MSKKTIKNNDIGKTIGIKAISIPKYSSAVINAANKYSKATRSENVSFVSDTIKKFKEDKSVNSHSLEEWEKWYNKQYPEAIEKATDDAWTKFEEMRNELSKVTREHVKEWEKDLIINKTYSGLMIQHAIINIIAKELKVDSRISTITEEGQGIDGYINNIPVQIKSKTYIEEVKIERINEKIVIIYYEKDNRTSDITFEYNESDFK